MYLFIVDKTSEEWEKQYKSTSTLYTSTHTYTYYIFINIIKKSLSKWVDALRALKSIHSMWTRYTFRFSITICYFLINFLFFLFFPTYINNATLNFDVEAYKNSFLFLYAVLFTKLLLIYIRHTAKNRVIWFPLTGNSSAKIRWQKLFRTQMNSVFQKKIFFYITEKKTQIIQTTENALSFFFLHKINWLNWMGTKRLQFIWKLKAHST